MSKPTQIYIDDSGMVHVSYPCDTCSEWVHTEDHCGDTKPDGTDEYMCGDCYGKRANSIDEMYIHDWLIMFVDFDWKPNVRVAIHKDVINPEHSCDVDHSSPDPDDDITRFGPGTSAMSLQAIDDLHADVNAVYCLVDSGIIDGKKAHLIFTKPLTFGQQIVVENMVEWLQSFRENVDDYEDQDSLDELLNNGRALVNGGAA
tara:strand:- start:299 stop:904 length:606 start_codon:yes stop_codon:yes gene_type:complete